MKLLRLSLYILLSAQLAGANAHSSVSCPVSVQHDREKLTRAFNAALRSLGIDPNHKDIKDKIMNCDFEADMRDYLGYLVNKSNVALQQFQNKYKRKPKEEDLDAAYLIFLETYEQVGQKVTSISADAGVKNGKVSHVPNVSDLYTAAAARVSDVESSLNDLSQKTEKKKKKEKATHDLQEGSKCGHGHYHHGCGGCCGGH